MRTITVLVIEDDAVYASLVERMLGESRDVRFEVHITDSLITGLGRLTRESFDVVLLDLSLPDSEGWEGVARIRADSPDVPLVVVTALQDEATEVEVLHLGAQDYLVKDKLESNLLIRAIQYAIERKRSETALRLAEEKYRTIFENSLEGIFQTTPEGRYLSANPALARIYGYDSPDDLIASVTDIASGIYVLPGRRDAFIRIMQEQGLVTDFESQIRRKDGSIIWISENVRVVRDAAGRLVCYEGTVEDITERRRAEERVRESEALYHSLVENLPQNIFRKDLSERFTFANQRFCQTLGRPLEEILGKTDFDFFPPEMAAKFQADDRRVIETGQPFHTVEENQPPGGGKMYVEVVKTPLHDAHDTIVGLQGIFWDITDRRLAEERERQAKEELSRSREELRVKNQEMESDLKMACELQQALLPQQYPVFPRGAEPQASALQFQHRYFPTGAVGGDFFNVFALSDTRAGIFICDVMGHGVRSALVTAMMRAVVEELVPVAADPGQLLTVINRDLRAILRQVGTTTFTTGFYMVADLAEGRLRYANAGHPKPLLVRRGSSTGEPLHNAERKSWPALGLFEDSVYPTTECVIEPGDWLLLFTDGLFEVESPSEEFYSQELLSAAFGRRRHLPFSQAIDEVLAEIKQFSRSPVFNDDVCLVGVEVLRTGLPSR